MEERLSRALLNIHAVLIKFTHTSYTKRHDHAHPSSARARERAKRLLARARDMVGLPIYPSTEAKQQLMAFFKHNLSI